MCILNFVHGFFALNFLTGFFVEMNPPTILGIFSNVPQGFTWKWTEEKVPHPFPDLCISTINMQSNPVGFHPSKIFSQQKDDSTSLEMQEGDDKKWL